MGLTLNELNQKQILMRSICSATITANIAAIFLIATTHRLQKPINYLQLCVSVCDIGLAIIWTIGSDSSDSTTTSDNNNSATLCLAIAFAYEFFLTAMSSWLFVKSVYTFLLLRHGPRVANQWWWAYHAYAWVMATGMAVIIVAIGVRNPAVIGDATFECWIGPEFPELRFVMQYPLFWIHFASSATLYILVIQRNRALRKGSAQFLFQHAGRMAVPEVVAENCGADYNQADANLTFGDIADCGELAEIGCVAGGEIDADRCNSDKEEAFNESFGARKLATSVMAVAAGTSSKTLELILMEEHINDFDRNNNNNNSNSNNNIHYSVNYSVADSRVTALRNSFMLSSIPHHNQMPEDTPSSHVPLSFQFPTPSTQAGNSRAATIKRFGFQDGGGAGRQQQQPVRKRQSLQPTIKSKSSQQTINADKKLFEKTGLILAGFLVSWTPATVVRTVGLVKPDYNPPFWLEMMMGCGFAISGLWNVGIFFWVWFGPRSKKPSLSDPNNEKTLVIK
ncbi:hypothetical protein HK100_006388 [Physocladia obscura]|uniref:G-protein coupled receptors family 2 profile 2 domain-containing protein n=1 Tax=Physocladia obscura TaxID=109957 RepID=A0AAD5SRI0_9FUNG|nr:hypothetical protein HK100_006388 [Physocladia obscura]